MTVQYISLIFLLQLSSSIYAAEDNLTVLMQSMKTVKPVKIAYKEIRHLELMDQPWKGSGFMYSMPPGLMIKEQLLPQKILMGVNGDQLYYFDVDSGMRHQSELSEESPYSLNIIIFKALMNADEPLLRKKYWVDLSFTDKRWVMNLKSKNTNDSMTKILVSGLLNQQVDTISLIQQDGDSSEFILHYLAITDEINSQINKRYQELRGE